MNKYETVLLIQGDLLKEQGILIENLMKERDEAIRNLKTASDQWKIWRKELFKD